MDWIGPKRIVVDGQQEEEEDDAARHGGGFECHGTLVIQYPCPIHVTLLWTDFLTRSQFAGSVLSSQPAAHHSPTKTVAKVM
uniref:HDC01125 n=1 Tax=Drosophila melanogaster TaxID=7227 RepID=Q6IHT2_DROME|nr:TPA_inf: HDC01125 [Drosophila melanogaster]